MGQWVSWCFRPGASVSSLGPAHQSQRFPPSLLCNDGSRAACGDSTWASSWQARCLWTSDLWHWWSPVCLQGFSSADSQASSQTEWTQSLPLTELTNLGYFVKSSTHTTWFSLLLTLQWEVIELVGQVGHQVSCGTALAQIVNSLDEVCDHFTDGTAVLCRVFGVQHTFVQSGPQVVPLFALPTDRNTDVVSQLLECFVIRKKNRTCP